MKKILKTIFLVLLLLVLTAYLTGVFYFKTHFLPNTSINGINSSYLTSEAADAAVSAVDPVLNVIQKNKDGKEAVSEEVHINDLSAEPLVYHTEKLLDAQNRFTWFLSFFTPNELTCSEIGGKSDEAKIKDAAKKLYCLQANNTIEPVDAHIELKNGDPTIVKEEDGCKIAEDKVIQLLTSTFDSYLKGEKNGLFIKKCGDINSLKGRS